MIEKEEFISRWKEEFGCTCGSPICWCDTSIKLGFLYDDLVEGISTHILSYADRDKVVPGTIGEENLPEFMDYRR